MEEPGGLQSMGLRSFISVLTRWEEVNSEKNRKWKCMEHHTGSQRNIPILPEVQRETEPGEEGESVDIPALIRKTQSSQVGRRGWREPSGKVGRSSGRTPRGGGGEVSGVSGGAGGGESQGPGSLVDCRLWGRAELDTTEAT